MSQTHRDIQLITADFETHQALIREVRHEVFVVGQSVSEEDEWDGLDPLPDTLHLLALAANGEAAGTARILPGGIIGRMAVRAPHRGRGIGGALVEALVQAARTRGETRCTLGAQLHAIPFYEKHGFVAEGEVFLDAGISHRRMTRKLG